MRLSDWRSSAPTRDALTQKVLAVVAPVLSAIGAEDDPHVWVVWGDDPSIRYQVLAITAAGLVTCSVRVNVSGEGPRASAKLTRWSRVQLGEVTVETGVGSRLVVAGQVENLVIRTAGDEAERAAQFFQGLLAAIDGRPIPSLDVARRRRRSGRRGRRPRRRQPGRRRRAKRAKPTTAMPTTATPGGGKPAASKSAAKHATVSATKQPSSAAAAPPSGSARARTTRSG